MKTAASLALLNTHLGPHAQGSVDTEGKLVYGFAAGSIGSLMGNLLVDQLRQANVANLKMNYMTGNGSRVAHEFTKHAAPDGKTLILASSTSLTLFSQIYGKRLNYEVKDFTPIAPLYSYTRLLMVGSSVPSSVKSLDDYMRWIQANPTQSNIGISAIGAGSHFAATLLAQSRDTVLRPVIYRGTDSALKDLASGNLPAAIILTDQNSKYVQSGLVRVLAVTSAGRWPAWPDVPTMKEQGVPDCAMSEWHGILGPAGMDPNKVKALSIAIRRALQQDDIVTTARKVGLSFLDMDPAQFTGLIEADQAQWQRTLSLTKFRGLE